MNIIAHRGQWDKPEHKNTMPAFEKAIKNGYGIETDVREYNGKLVLSHDIADSSSVSCSKLFEYYTKNESNAYLALNVKEDGIQRIIQGLLCEYAIKNYFFFDMSVPEMVVYREMGIPFFTRRSDIEHELVLYSDAAGVWVDAFYDDWDMISAIAKHLEDRKMVSLISPEIHKKNEKKIWEELRSSGIADRTGFFLCTDYPQKAEEFFGGK